jgi:hypothetical protein
MKLKRFLQTGPIVMSFMGCIVPLAHAQSFKVTGVSLTATPATYEGPCPATVNFEGRVTVNGKGAVRYTWLRDDGATAPVHTLTFAAAGSKSVSMRRTVGSYERRPSASGWEAIKILEPNLTESNRASFTVTCRQPITPPTAQTHGVPKPGEGLIKEQPVVPSLPVIDEFRADLTGCDLPDPNRPLLSFRASHLIAHIQINAISRDGRERPVFGESALSIPGSPASAPMGSLGPWVSIQRSGLRDPGADADTKTYILVARGASGQEVSARRDVIYLKGPVSLDVSDPTIYEGTCCENSVRMTGVNYEGIAIDGSYPTASGLTRSFHRRASEVIMRENGVVFHSDHKLNEHGDATIRLTAFGRVPRCPGQQVERTVILYKPTGFPWPMLPTPR